MKCQRVFFSHFFSQQWTHTSKSSCKLLWPQEWGWRVWQHTVTADIWNIFFWWLLTARQQLLGRDGMELSVVYHQELIKAWPMLTHTHTCWDETWVIQKKSKIDAFLLRFCRTHGSWVFPCCVFLQFKLSVVHNVWLSIQLRERTLLWKCCYGEPLGQIS